MATLISAPEELFVDELERKLIVLNEQVELLKEEVRSNFQQLHDLLAVRETFLIKEMDDIVTRVRQEITEKRTNLQQLYTARESLERDLTQNTFKELLEKNLLAIQDNIGKELARDVTVGWIELDWKREQLEQSVIEVCEVVPLSEKPVTPVDMPVAVTTVDYSAKLCPVWSRDGTGSSQIIHPMQMVIDNITQNIFVADFGGSRIQVFNEEGNHLYQISTPLRPVGLALTDEYIFVSTPNSLAKLEKSSKLQPICIKYVATKRAVSGMDTNSNSDIYGCEIFYQSVIVFDKNLEFLVRIKLKTNQVRFDTLTYNIKLHEDEMYVMFGSLVFNPPFHLQIFNKEGELVRCLIKKSEIGTSYFFSIDQLGNILVADLYDHQIKIFSKEGNVIHTITTGMLPGDQKIHLPVGIAIDKKNRIIVAQRNKKCNLLAF